jgi:two-component system, OmpR family, KDP operon response regulator KdpE
MVKGSKILVIEDEPEVRRFLRASLVTNGYAFTECESGKEGLDQVVHQRPDLVLLDLGLPDIDGMDVIRQLRQWNRVPIIVISARGRDAQKIEALDAGADDYLTKPFSVIELLARIRVALRHAAQAADAPRSPTFTVDILHVDLSTRQVFVSGTPVHLSPIEYRLLSALVRYPGKVLTHRQLFSAAWGPDTVFETSYLRVYMKHLRDKIEPDPAQPRFLITEPGIGYRLIS